MWDLGPYLLDPKSFRLTRDGRSIPIQRRPLDLLIHLVARSGQVVSHAELLANVWGGIRVSAGSLTQAAYEARVALDDLDRAAPQRWIRTVRGRGFSFSGPVRAHAAVCPADPIPFVGREGPMAELSSAVDEALRGRGRTIWIEGPPGIGKSRLIAEALAPARGLPVHFANCAPSDPPSWPISLLRRSLAQEAPGTRDALPSRGAVGLESEVARKARDGALALVVEDLHWADASSIAALESFVPRADRLPILLVLSARTEQAHNNSLLRLSHLASVRRIALPALRIHDVFVILTATLGRPPSPDVASAVLRRSEGLPLLVRVFAERLATGSDPASIAPDIGGAWFADRLAELDAPTAHAIAVAALCGQEFDLWLVESALGRTDREWIHRAQRAQFIEPVPDRPLRFRFRHALMQESAAARLEGSERDALHVSIADALVETAGKEDSYHIARVAHHYTAGALAVRDTSRALRFTLLAARLAAGNFEWPAVRNNCRVALRWLEGMPASAQRIRYEIEAASLLLAGVSTQSDRSDESNRLLRRLRPLVDAHGGAENRREALWFECARARAEGDFTAARAAIAEASTLPCGAEVAENWSRSIASLAGELEAALAPVGSADQFPGDPLLADVATKSGRDPWVERFALTAFAAWAAGDDADAVRRIHIARSWSSERRDPRGQIWARFLATLLHELRRDWEAVLEAAADIDPLADRHGITAWHGSGAGLSFWADCQRRSDRDFPSERLARIFLDRGSSADTSFRSAMLLLAGRSYAWRRELARAAAALDEAISFCSKTQERLLLAEALRNRALLASAEGDRGGARLLLERATRVAREQGALTLEVRALCASIRLGLAGSPGERDRLRALEKQARSLGASERLRIASLPL